MSKASVELSPASLALRRDAKSTPLRSTALGKDRHRAAGALMVAGVTAALLLGTFARLMNYEMRRDEQLYVPPARLLATDAPYLDFFYNHVPGSAWIFHAVMQAIGTDHLLMAGRLAVFLAWAGLAVAVAFITYALARSLVITLACLVLLLCNDLLLGPSGATATNNFLPLAFAYAGMGLWVIGMRRRRRAACMALAGFSLAAAAATKISFVVFIPVFGLAAFLLPQDEAFATRLVRSVLPLVAGGLVGSLPVLYYLAVIPDTFLSHVLLYHTGPHLEYYASRNVADDDVAFSLAEKARFAYMVWFTGANVFLALLLIVLLVKLAGAGRLRAALSSGPTLTIGAATVLALVASFIPTPSFPQYFTPPIMGALLLAALLYGSLDERSRAELRAPIVALTALVALLGLPRIAGGIPKIAKPGEWTVGRVHAAGVAIRSAIERGGVEGKVATLLPIYPLEARLPVYRELATGQFAYRIGDLAKPELMARYVSTSPSRVEALLAADPPAAILVGFEPTLEQPLIRYAESHGYIRQPDVLVQDRYGSGVLYVRPRSPP